jgi:hypothetical protein
MLTSQLTTLLRFLRPRFIGDDGGGSDSGATQIALEKQRQDAIRAAQRRIDLMFDGGRGGVGAVDPSQLQYGTTYYDTAGNPVSFSDPYAPKTSAGGTGTVADRIGALVSGMYSPLAAIGANRHPTYNGQLYSGVADGGHGFDDSYYKGIAKAYEDYYLPLVTEQYKVAQRKLALGSPSTNSSAYLRDVGDLERDYEREQVGVKDRAQQSVADARNKVESNRADLYRLADTGVGIDSIANQASERAASLTTPPAYSPIGDLFSAYTGDYVNRLVAQRSGYDVGANPLLFDNSKRKGSVVTVNS